MGENYLDMVPVIVIFFALGILGLTLYFRCLVFVFHGYIYSSHKDNLVNFIITY